MDNALQNLVQRRIKDETLFPNISLAISRDINLAIRDVFDEMSKTIENDFSHIKGDFHSVMTQIEVWSGDEERKKLEERQYMKQLSPKLHKLQKNHEVVLRIISHV